MTQQQEEPRPQRRRKPRYNRPKIGDDPRNANELVRAMHRAGVTHPDLDELVGVQKDPGKGDKSGKQGNSSRETTVEETSMANTQQQENKGKGKPPVGKDDDTNEEGELELSAFEPIVPFAKKTFITVGAYALGFIGAGLTLMKGAQVMGFGKSNVELPLLPPGGNETLGE